MFDIQSSLTTPDSKYYYHSSFTDEETDAQRD